MAAILKIQYGRQKQKFRKGNMVFQIPGALSFPTMYSFAKEKEIVNLDIMNLMTNLMAAFRKKMAITFIDPYGYLLTSCFCDQKGILNKMRPPTEDPGGYKFTPMLAHGLLIIIIRGESFMFARRIVFQDYRRAVPRSLASVSITTT